MCRRGNSAIKIIVVIMQQFYIEIRFNKHTHVLNSVQIFWILLKVFSVLEIHFNIVHFHSTSIPFKDLYTNISSLVHTVLYIKFFTLQKSVVKSPKMPTHSLKIPWKKQILSSRLRSSIYKVPNSFLSTSKQQKQNSKNSTKY